MLPQARPLARIPSVLAISGPRRKLAHTQRSLRQRLGLAASCSAPPHRLREYLLRLTPHRLVENFPFDVAESLKENQRSRAVV